VSYNRLVDEIGREHLKEKPPGPFAVGDEVDVHVRIQEAEKERVQIFRGVVISRKGRGPDEMFTVRRVVQGEGVERVFPLHSPMVDRVKVRKRGRVRRSKLYYLRELSGRAARLKELRGAGRSPPPDRAEEAKEKAEGEPKQEGKAAAAKKKGTKSGSRK